MTMKLDVTKVLQGRPRNLLVFNSYCLSPIKLWLLTGRCATQLARAVCAQPAGSEVPVTFLCVCGRFPNHTAPTAARLSLRTGHLSTCPYMRTDGNQVHQQCQAVCW